MSISITIKSGENQPFAVEINGFPTEVVLENEGRALSFLPIGLFLLVFLYMGLNSLVPVLALPVVLVAGAVFAGVAVMIIRRNGRKNVMVFEKYKVVVTEVGPLKDKQWEEDYRNFEGILLRSRTAKSGRTRSTYQVIELKHAEPKKTLPLFVNLTGVSPKKRWNEYSDLFNLPKLTGR